MDLPIYCGYSVISQSLFTCSSYFRASSSSSWYSQLFCRNTLLYQTCSAETNFCTKKPLHKLALTHITFYPSPHLHQPAFAQTSFYPNLILPEPPSTFTATNFYIKQQLVFICPNQLQPKTAWCTVECRRLWNIHSQCIPMDLDIYMDSNNNQVTTISRYFKQFHLLLWIKTNAWYCVTDLNKQWLDQLLATNETDWKYHPIHHY